MSFLKCALCAEKDLRIDDHKKEIERLCAQVETFRKLAFPEKRTELSPQELEFNRLMGEHSEEESRRIDLEAHNLLTGGEL